MSKHLIRAWTLAGVAALALGPRPAARAADLDPPMPALETVTDPKQIATIDVPKGAKLSTERMATEAAFLGVWTVDLDGDASTTEATVYLGQRTGFGSAVLAGSMDHGCRWGTLEADSVVVKSGEWRDLRSESEHNEVFRQRIVAQKGQVFFAVVQMKSTAYDPWKTHVEALLDTFKVPGTPAGASFPEGYKLIASKPGDVYSDAKKGDTDRIVREWANVVAMWPKVLAGSPVFTNTPRLVLCGTDEAYDASWTSDAKGAPPNTAYYNQFDRAVYVRLSRRAEDAFVDEMQRATGEQMSSYFFGGMTPLWLSQGLRMYLREGVTANGHFDQPRAAVIEKARKSANERNVTFADIVGMTDIPRGARTGIDLELYSWHFWFRNGPGAKPMGDRYKKYIDTLRSTGDVREATKAWDGVDHAALKTAYSEWIQRWREGKSQ